MWPLFIKYMRHNTTQMYENCMKNIKKIIWLFQIIFSFFYYLLEHPENELIFLRSIFVLDEFADFLNQSYIDNPSFFWRKVINSIKLFWNFLSKLFFYQIKFRSIFWFYLSSNFFITQNLFESFLISLSKNSLSKK